MAAETTRLPIIDCAQVSKQGESKKGGGEEKNDAAPQERGSSKSEEVAAFLASVRLGSLERQPRPGDVYRRSYYAPSSHPRPLGLIPDRGDALDGFSRLLGLPPIFPTDRLQHVANAAGDAGSGGHIETDYTGTSVVFRHPAAEENRRHLPSAVSHVTNTANTTVAGVDDREYADTLAKCKMQDYVAASEINVVPKYSVNVSLMNRHRRTKPVPQTGMKLLHSESKTTRCAEYFSFINPANLTSKPLYLDQRLAVECAECERCRVRGGKCARCLALRVGGGYIILDGSELSDEEKARRSKKRYQLSGSRLDRSGDHGNRKSRRPIRFGSGVLSDGSRVTGRDGEGDGEGGMERRGVGEVAGGGGRGWEGGDGKGVGGGWGESGRGRGDENGGGLGYDAADREKGGGVHGAGGRGDGEDGRGYGGGDRSGRMGSAIGGRMGAGEGVGGGGEWDGDGMESGRQSNLSQRAGSRMAGSRPGSRFGTRPPSSMRRLGRGSDQRKKGVKLEGQSMGGGDGGWDDGDGRRRRRRGGEGEDDENGQGQRSAYDYRGDDDDLEETTSGSLGDLMKFRSKRRDNVKALKATLKELQGIDPLDYLAKYCIIDKEKLPHYQRAYENVDRDEDNEIDIAELDFALKAVNSDLISDSELSYVHSVLELAGRHKLNFRFFSLIAALSEKVVALDDMVKRLLNKMDFEALEVKIQKCKELFYLLADTEQVEQGGVVTVSSLAVELQAGGLTQDHVDYVCEHLNHEGRGLVEFLDYLTYVPLFVEIHGNIYDNPLDFTRTK